MTDSLDFLSAPDQARRLAVFSFVCLYGTVGAVGVAALHGSAPPYFDLAGGMILAALVVLGAVRASRIAVTANEQDVRIANQFRNYRISWNDVDRVEMSTIPTPFGAYRPALKFHRKTGFAIKAQAV